MKMDDECLASIRPLDAFEFNAILTSIEKDLAEMNCLIMGVRQIPDRSACFAGIPLDLIVKLHFQQPTNCLEGFSATSGESRTFWLLKELSGMFEKLSESHMMRRLRRQSNGDQRGGLVRQNALTSWVDDV
jgi:hypothetical protein